MSETNSSKTKQVQPGPDSQKQRWIKYGANVVLTVVLVVVLAGAVTYLVQERHIQADTTETGAFSLKPQTISIIESNEQDIQLVALYPREETKLRGKGPVQDFYRPVADILDEYSRRGKHIKTEIIDSVKEPVKMDQLIESVTKRYINEVESYKEFLNSGFPKTFEQIKKFAEEEGKKLSALEPVLPQITERAQKQSMLQAFLTVGGFPQMLQDTQDRIKKEKEKENTVEIPDYKGLVDQVRQDLENLSAVLSSTSELFDKIVKSKAKMPPELLTYMTEAPARFNEARKWSDELVEKSKKLGDLKLDSIRQVLKETESDNQPPRRILVMGESEMRVIPFKSVWKPATTGGRRPGQAAEEQKLRFTGEQEITSAILSLKEMSAITRQIDHALDASKKAAIATSTDPAHQAEAKDAQSRAQQVTEMLRESRKLVEDRKYAQAMSLLKDAVANMPHEQALAVALVDAQKLLKSKTICFVRPGGPPLTSAGGPFGGAGPLSVIAERLKQFNFEVVEKDISGTWAMQAQMQEQPMPPEPEPKDEDIKDAIWVCTSYAPPFSRSGPNMLGQKLQEHLNGGGSALVLFYPEADDLSASLKEWGVTVKTNMITVHEVPKNQPDREPTDLAERALWNPVVFVLDSFGNHPLVRPVQDLDGVFFTLLPVQISKANGVDAVPLMPIPQSPNSWGETDLRGAMSGEDVKFDIGTDLANTTSSPIYAGAALENAKSRLVVFGGLDFMANNVLRVTDQRTPAARFPANGELVCDAVLWLARQDSMIAMSPAALEVSRISSESHPVQKVQGVTVSIPGATAVGLMLLACVGFGLFMYFRRMD